MRRRVIAGAGAAGAGLFGAALIHFSRGWISPPRVALDPPEGDQFEEVSFSSEDGLPLYGWFLRGDNSAPGIVLCHGYQRGIEETFSLGCDLRARGFHVFLFDFRGCGRSGGRYTTLGHREPLDALAAVRWLRVRLGDEAPLGMLGISMGGAVTLMTAARCPELRAVVSDSAFATLMGAVRQRFRGSRFPQLQGYYLSMYAAERLSGGRVRDVRPVDAAATLTVTPVLLIHSRADQVVPFSEAEQLDAALPGPHEFWVLDDIEHARVRFSRREEYLDRVAGFFTRHLVRSDERVATPA